MKSPVIISRSLLLLFIPQTLFMPIKIFSIFFSFFVSYGSFPFTCQYFWPVLVCLSFVDRCVCPGGWRGWDHRFNHCSGTHAGGHHHRGRNTVLQVGLYLHLRMFHSIKSLKEIIFYLTSIKKFKDWNEEKLVNKRPMGHITHLRNSSNQTNICA